MEKSLFTKIIDREIPARIVFENDYVIAFLDINPVNAGHTLVVPKNVQPDILASSNDDLLEVFKVIREITPAIVLAVHADGFNVVTNKGVAAGQSVFHTHFHIIPRFEGDGHKAWGHTTLSNDEFDKVLTDIKSNL